ncbi:DUF47 family protein [Candidatus Bathyarchaeota archaeon]|nr:DUF47 family protein [Candidatus Bathyarchaeota archaeon]
METVRKLALMTDSMVDKQNEKAKQQYKEIQGMGEQSAKMRSNILEQVASLGLFLMNREDFLRLIFRLSEIMDTVEGVAFRLASTLERKITLESKFMKGISELTGVILEEATKMRETLMSLTFNPSKALEMAASVEEAERRIDATYRELDLEILTSKTSVPALLVLKDIVERLEKTADLIIDALDQIRVLAVSS